MLKLARLPIERQRNVGNALSELFKVKGTYVAAVEAPAKTVIEATAGLTVVEGPSMFVIDGTTDSVITAIFRITEAAEKGLVDTVIPLGKEQQDALAATETIFELWFPNGVGFIRDQVGLQCDVMLEMRKTYHDKDKGPELKAALKTLGLGALASHFLNHVAVYAKKLGLTADVEETVSSGDVSETWHDAYVYFAAAVTVAYKNDPATRKVLLGSYERQLDEHRALSAKERQRQRRKKDEPKKDEPKKDDG